MPILKKRKRSIRKPREIKEPKVWELFVSQPEVTSSSLAAESTLLTAHSPKHTHREWIFEMGAEWLKWGRLQGNLQGPGLGTWTFGFQLLEPPLLKEAPSPSLYLALNQHSPYTHTLPITPPPLSPLQSLQAHLEWKTSQALPVRSEKPRQQSLLLVIQRLRSIIFKSVRTGKTWSKPVWYPSQQARPWQPYLCVSH